MKIHELKQGTPEWLALRATHFTASEAQAMMGASKYMSRTQLLDLKKSGIAKEVDEFTQNLFDKGHAVEELARALVEESEGEDFYPVTGSLEIDGLKLLASFDGLNLAGDIAWEHKLWNAKLAETVSGGDIPETHYWQLEQQLLVSGADKVIFVVSDGTVENIEIYHYYSAVGMREQLIAGWKQFAIDLQAHEVKPAEIKVVAEATMSLPALLIQVGGEISIQSNLVKFGERLKAFITETNSKPETDQDFANLEAACKTLKEAEEALKQAEVSALAQTASVDEMRRTVAFLSDIARTNRLMFEKLVKSEKENRKHAIVLIAQSALASYTALLQEEIKGINLPFERVNFADAIKGKKTLVSMQDAVDSMLAGAKIESNAVALDIRAKLAFYAANVEGHQFLFNDLQDLTTRPFEYFKMDIKMRIETYRAAEQERKVDEAWGRRLEPVTHQSVEAVIAQEAKRRDDKKNPPVYQMSYPGDDEMVFAIIAAFGVDDNIAVKWLRSFEV